MVNSMLRFLLTILIWCSCLALRAAEVSAELSTPSVEAGEGAFGDMDFMTRVLKDIAQGTEKGRLYAAGTAAVSVRAAGSSVAAAASAPTVPAPAKTVRRFSCGRSGELMVVSSTA